MSVKQKRHAIAYVIWNDQRDKILSVQRPANDDNLPNVWGLPAGSLRKNETFEGCVIRSGKDKLGVEMKIVKSIAEGEIEREQYILYMKEFETRITKGEPSVPQDVQEVTQYQNWKWADPSILKDAAQKGSLCSRLLLDNLSISY